MVRLKRVFESYLYLESKKDLDDLKAYLGDKLFDDYMKIRDRIPKDQNEFKDFSKLKKMDKKDIQDFVSSFQSKSDKRKSDKTEGAEKLYEDSDWVVYKITTYPAAQLYGKGTKWCITGRYPGEEGRGEYFFDKYIRENNLDGGYYFYISKKDPKEKYCLLLKNSGKIHSIWDAEDTHKGSSIEDLDVTLPDIKNIAAIDKSKFDINDVLEAIYDEEIDTLKEYLENGANPNSVINTYGDTIFHDACKTENEDIIKLLLKYKADPNIKGINGYSALRNAVNNEDVYLVKLLLEYGADPNTRDTVAKITPIMYLDSYNLDIADALLDYGADIDAQDELGNTALHYAVSTGPNRMGDYDFVKYLLEHGANISIKNKKGEYPYDLVKDGDIESLFFGDEDDDYDDYNEDE